MYAVSSPAPGKPEDTGGYYNGCYYRHGEPAFRVGAAVFLEADVDDV